ncbi:MAG: SMI1/KNR4 family protein [Thomasclavelia sp.]|nr:SMI1/KNR4 family protein [Thomasclavelia sp.]
MYKDSIELLKKNNVTFEKGLSADEILQIEKQYDISFPTSLRKFLMTELPVSKGFYNWRNFDIENIKYIKNMIKQPIQYINDMPQEIYWCEDWGKEPENLESFKDEVKKRLAKAPKLIPIYSHRYMPMLDNENPPIISVHGGDVIYMGKDLYDYFMVEYGSKKQTEISFSSIKSIPFWSDIM